MLILGRRGDAGLRRTTPFECGILSGRTSLTRFGFRQREQERHTTAANRVIRKDRAGRREGRMEGVMEMEMLSCLVMLRVYSKSEASFEGLFKCLLFKVIKHGDEMSN